MPRKVMVLVATKLSLVLVVSFLHALILPTYVVSLSLSLQGISRFGVVVVSPNNILGGRKQQSLVVSRERMIRNNNMVTLADSVSTTIDPTNDERMPSLEDLQNVLVVAVAASHAAGALIREHAGGAQVTNRKANSRDLLTIVDPQCEQAIKDLVLQTFPHHEFLGEEMVAPGAEASKAALESLLHSDNNDWLWIVDPIDGTTNFVHGMPLCMPSVAVAYKGRVVVGVIYDPHRDELFSAIRGQGAYLNQQHVLHVGVQDVIGDAVVAMGSPPAAESLQMSLKGVAALMPKVRTIRMLGSAALMLAWVACGRLTAYWEYDLSSWDIAAGALLIEEAGGKFTDLSNEPYHLTTRKIIGSNGLVHESILKELNEAGVR